MPTGPEAETLAQSKAVDDRWWADTPKRRLNHIQPEVMGQFVPHLEANVIIVEALRDLVEYALDYRRITPRSLLLEVDAAIADRGKYDDSATRTPVAAIAHKLCEAAFTSGQGINTITPIFRQAVADIKAEPKTDLTKITPVQGQRILTVKPGLGM